MANSSSSSESKVRKKSRTIRKEKKSKTKSRRKSSSSRSSSRHQRWRSSSSSFPHRKRKASSSSSSSSPPVVKKASKKKKSKKKRKRDSSNSSVNSKASRKAKKMSRGEKLSSKESKNKEGKDKEARAKSPKNDTNGGRLPFEAGPGEKAQHAVAFAKNGGKKHLAGLGDLGVLQKTLEEERRRLKLFVIKAKQEWEERRERRNTNGVTDGSDYYQASIGEVFGPSKRFKVEERIGKGVFSSVFKCKDESEGKVYAVKFIRSNSLMRKVSEKEVEMYRHLASKAAKADPEGARHLIGLVGPETFEHQGHLCMVFGLLKCDLRFAIQKYGSGYGLPLPTVQQYSHQLFMALRTLHRLKLIHADLKPDNVLMSMDKTLVQLIDFGSAMHVNEYINSPYVQPRYYRAPEVMLGMEYDTQVDVWSLATTLFELTTGGVLFAGGSNNGMIKHMLDICGLFPTSMRIKSEFATKHFNSSGDFIFRCPKDNGGQEKLLPAQSFVKPQRPVLGQLQAALANAPETLDAEMHKVMLRRLADLLMHCTKPDPAKRITPEKALSHAFFKPLES